MTSRRMKIAILGGRGQFGRSFLSAVACAGCSWETALLGRPDFDLATPALLEKALSEVAFDAVLNFAAFHDTDAAETETSLADTINAEAVAAMAAACRMQGARFFHISTDYVFGADKARRTPYREDDQGAPVNAYGKSKLRGELLAAAACERTYVIRVASLFGIPEDGRTGRNFVETVLSLAADATPLRIVDDQTMSPTSAADAANVLIALLRDDPGPGIYHATGTGAANWHQFACEILNQAGVKTEVAAIASDVSGRAAARPAYSVLDNAKAAGIAGPIPHWRDALAAYLKATGRLPALTQAGHR